MLRLENLTTGYDRRELLLGANGVLADGELVTLIGANGSGKSTLLKVMCGELEPLNGRVTIGGDVVSGLGRRELSRRVSVVNTDKIEAEALTVFEVVAMGRYPYTGFFGRLGKDDRMAVEEAMNQVGIGGMSGRNIVSLSDGERQKVMIARALAQNTPVILLDEPTAFLDVASRVEVLALLRRLAHECGKGILLSSHDVASAIDLSDRLWLMPGDGTLRTGSPREFLEAHDRKEEGNGLDALFAGRSVMFDSVRRDFVGLDGGLRSV